MSRLKRSAGLAAMAALAVLAGCGAAPAGSPAAASPGAAKAASSSPGPVAQLDSASRVCARPGRYLTAIRTGKHHGYDRVVFQFSGGVPAVTAERVATGRRLVVTYMRMIITPVPAVPAAARRAGLTGWIRVTGWIGAIRGYRIHPVSQILPATARVRRFRALAVRQTFPGQATFPGSPARRDDIPRVA